MLAGMKAGGSWEAEKLEDNEAGELKRVGQGYFGIISASAGPYSLIRVHSCVFKNKMVLSQSRRDHRERP